jgi:hypothetical protein
MQVAVLIPVVADNIKTMQACGRRCRAAAFLLSL